MRNLFIIMCVAAFLAACGDDEGKPKSTADSGAKSAQAAPESAPAVPVSPGVSKTIDGISIVDHTRDEKEFEIRRSIGGVESMIKSYKEQGQDTAELEAKLEGLKKELQALVSG